MSTQRTTSTLAATLDDVAALFHQYVVLPAAAADGLALWAVNTYVHLCFSICPYVCITSPTKRSGKSIVLELLAELSHEPFEAIVPSAASIYRQLALHPTILIDEVDQSGFTPLLRAIFNRGYRAGGFVTRAHGKDGVLTFNVYGPKAFAGISGRTLPLPSTLLDRCLRVDLQRKAPDEHRVRFVRSIASVEAGLLRTRIEAWAEEARDHLSLPLDPPDVPDALDDRAAEIWGSLVVLADHAGDDWPARAEAAALHLSTAHDDPDEAECLLRDTRAVFDRHREPRIETANLINALPLLDDRTYLGPCTAIAVATLLRRFGIRPRPIRFGKLVRQGYLRGDFEPVWRRYLQ